MQNSSRDHIQSKTLSVLLVIETIETLEFLRNFFCEAKSIFRSFLRIEFFFIISFAYIWWVWCVCVTRIDRKWFLFEITVKLEIEKQSSLGSSRLRIFVEKKFPSDPENGTIVSSALVLPWSESFSFWFQHRNKFGCYQCDFRRFLRFALLFYRFSSRKEDRWIKWMRYSNRAEKCNKMCCGVFFLSTQE